MTRTDNLEDFSITITLDCGCEKIEMQFSELKNNGLYLVKCPKCGQEQRID